MTFFSTGWTCVELTLTALFGGGTFIFVPVSAVGLAHLILDEPVTPSLLQVSGGGGPTNRPAAARRVSP